jgi:hypothetical protein
VPEAEDIPSGGITNTVVDPIACAEIDPTITVLWGAVRDMPTGWKRRDFRDKNNHSVTVRVDYGESSMLFTGDLEEAAITDLIAKHGATALDVDLFKIGHHGYQSGTTPDLVAAVSPEIAVLSRTDQRRWFRGDYELYSGAMTRTRDPMPVPLWEYEPGLTPEEHEQYDEDGNPTVWGVTKGLFEADTLDKAIYWTGLEGTIVVSATSDGVLSVDE